MPPLENHHLTVIVDRGIFKVFDYSPFATTDLRSRSHLLPGEPEVVEGCSVRCIEQLTGFCIESD